MPAKTDPEKAPKRWAMAEAVIEAGPAAAVLYADESRIEWLPLLRAMSGTKSASESRIPTPGSNQVRNLFGALDIRPSHSTACLVHEHMYKEKLVAFLEHLLTVYTTGPIILIVDNYTITRLELVKDWLAEQSRLQLFYLPKYCSHLNPLENVWLRLKRQIAANHL